MTAEKRKQRAQKQLKQPRIQTCKLEQVVHSSINMISKRTAEKSNYREDWKMLSQRNMATAYYDGLKRSLNGQQSRHARLER